MCRRSDHVDLNEVIGTPRTRSIRCARDMGFRFEAGRFPRPAIVRGDRDELMQVIQNLVQNAFKYGTRAARS